MFRTIAFVLVASVPLLAGIRNLTMDQALEILDRKNLEIKISQFEETMKKYDELAVAGMNYIKGKQNGLSVGVINYAAQLHGVQLGVINYVKENPWYLRVLPLINFNFR